MSRAMLKLLGYPEERIRRLEQDLLTADVTPRVQRALEFVRRISQANPLPSAAEKQQVVAAGYSDVGVRELVFLAGVNIFYNRLSTLPALPTESAERLASSRLLTVFGPVIRRFMKRGNARPATLPDTRGMPFEYLVAAFGGSPLAAILAEGIREAWDSTALPRRAKGLAFAVVARGLSSPCAEREALRLLAEEGLDAREVGDILAHLASPRLDPIEAALVPFARETVSYRPAHIQRRTRTLHALLTPTQCLELVGIVALANAVCRMDVALDQ